jgi:proteasome maturation protein
MLPHELEVPTESLLTHQPGQSLAEDSKTRHPMEVIMKNLPKTEFQTKVRNRAMQYGPASAIHLQMDRAILSTVQRLPCLPSDRVGLECVLGSDQTMGYEDFLGDPDLDVANTAVKMSVADIVEAGLG